MKTFFGNFKKTMRELSWPKKKDSFMDTVFVMVATVILSTMIFGWTSLIEKIISWIMSLF